MRISLMTGFFGFKSNGEYTSLLESMKRCKAAGFSVQDICFCRALTGQTELAKDNWKELINNIRNEAEKEGIEFSQSHLVYLPGDLEEQSPETLENFKEMMVRSIIASSMLGVKWAVLHPVELRISDFGNTEANIKKNIEFYHETVELAKKNNVGLAFENMTESKKKHRFTGTAYELCELIDAFNDSGIGACWDFGHGNMLYKDQTIALKTLGKRLKATHINDNRGTADDHMFPFHGTVDWHSIMPVFKEIGYEGDFTYETHNESKGLSEPLKDSIAKIGYKIAEYCMTLV
ncbi:MAG: sugar phosphate isomerase/epimerase [Clostridiaceae bacterium]|jgi:sugar phosphate isomerase/epimerase|nr:sugar phosphate isomerase/epimerase [Clostridiaceae bacterium]